MFYFNDYCGYVKFDLSKLTQYDFWYAEYAAAPACIYNFQMWQFSSKGQVAGISSDVDMNLCFVPYPKPAGTEEPVTTEAPAESPLPTDAPAGEPEPSPTPSDQTWFV